MSTHLAEGVTPATRLPHPRFSWLRNVRVLIDGESPTLDVAGRVLEQFGAEVAQLNASTTSEADVILVDRIGGGVVKDAVGPPRSAAEYSAFVKATNRRVWVTATGFGLSTPKANDAASDLTLLAAGGILGHSRIGDDWAPTVPPGDLALKIAGYVMAVAALHAVHELRTTGKPIHVDMSARDAVIATGLTLEMAHALSNCPDEGGSARYGAPSGFFECANGRIYVLVLEQHQWQAFRTALAPLLDSVETLVDARNNADFVNSQLAAWTANRPVEECERLLQEAGVPASEVNSLATLSERAEAAGRPVDLTGPKAPPLPAQVFAPPRQSGTARRGQIPLSQLRILDAGHVLAVPLAAAWLGAMGANVAKLEDPARLDIYRRRGPFADGVAGPNRSAYFNQLNFSKSQLQVNIGQPGEAVDLDAFDVVMHNLTPRRAATVGVDLNTAITGAPKLAISSSGYGGTGPWANYRAYGHNIHAFAGLVAGTRDARGEMGDMGTPWADPLTSVGIAAWVLAWSLNDGDRQGLGVDISMAELTAAQIIDLNGRSLEQTYAPAQVGGHFFVRPASGPLLAVSLRDEAEVALFEGVAGLQFPSDVSLGQELPEWTPDADIERRLRQAGIPVALVLTAHDLVEDQDLLRSGVFTSVSSEALGAYRVTGLPWRFAGQRPITATAAPEVQS